MKRQLRVPASIEDKQSFSIPRLAPERQFEIGELYLFHRKNSRCPSISSLWGIFNGYKEGRLSLESSSHNLPLAYFTGRVSLLPTCQSA